MVIGCPTCQFSSSEHPFCGHYETLMHSFAEASLVLDFTLNYYPVALAVKCKLRGGLKGLRMSFGTGPMWTRFYSNNEKSGLGRTCKNQTPSKPWVSNCTPSGMSDFRDLLGKTTESPMNGVGGTKPQRERERYLWISMIWHFLTLFKWALGSTHTLMEIHTFRHNSL